MISGRKEKRYGFTDRPEVSDALGMNSRCRGIARFVESCETPVTMAVQGDWGTGKTTAMQIIKSNLSEKNQKCTIWFNTWEFSSYSRTESIMTGLVELMILRLREYLGKPDEKLSRDAACVAKKVLGVAGECFTPAKVLDSVIEKFGSDDKRTDSIREIIHQKNTLDQLVNELKLKEDDRFFITTTIPLMSIVLH